MPPLPLIRLRRLSRAVTLVVTFLFPLSACVDNWDTDWVVSDYPVKTRTNVGGNITPEYVSVKHGERVSFLVTVDEGYNIAQISGCNGTLSGTIYTTGQVTRECLISAVFSVSNYPVFTIVGTGGGITPSYRSAQHGESVSFEITPQDGYEIASVTGCGGVLSGTTYITGPVIRECSVRAIFRVTNYPVNTSVGEGGSIAPSYRSAQHGESVSFEIITEDGYEIASVTGCDGTLSGNTYITGQVTQGCSVSVSFGLVLHNVTASADSKGSMAPPARSVRHGETASFTVTPLEGYEIDNVSGCNGSLSGTIYTTGPISGECGITASFIRKIHTVTSSAGAGGTVSPPAVPVAHGDTASFVITPLTGYRIDTVSGCNGSLSGEIYTTGAITAECSVNASFIRNPPAGAAEPALTIGAIKRFHFSWTDLPDATYYRLLENPDGISGYSPVGDDIPAGLRQAALEVPLHLRATARYILQSCNEGGCSSSTGLAVNGTLAEGIGYFKAGNAGATDQFGYAIALSGDGTTLAVGAPAEDGSGTGVNSGNNNLATNSGAVYIFTKGADGWIQQAYIKASNTGAGDRFGFSVDLNHEGDVLAIGAYREDSAARGVDGSQGDNSATDSGAVYLFTRTGNQWVQQAYIKAGNSGSGDNFGYSVALSGDGRTLAVGAPGEDSSGANGNDDSATDSGAVYIFSNGAGIWSQQAYIKAANSGAGDLFGSAIDLSGDGRTLAVGAPEEDGSSTAINGDGSSNSRSNSGAVYLFLLGQNGWEQQAYVKAGNAGAGDNLGHSVALSGRGDTLAAGAWGENSAARGVDGDGGNNSAADAGAVYIYVLRDGTWQPQAYLKAENIDPGDRFGWSVSMDGSGDILAVGARLEDSSAIGVEGDATDNSMSGAGAAYLFTRSSGLWHQKSYVKASNSGTGDQFGRAVTLSENGATLAVAGYREDGSATGINGEPFDDSRGNSGAVYLY